MGEGRGRENAIREGVFIDDIRGEIWHNPIWLSKVISIWHNPRAFILVIAKISIFLVRVSLNCIYCHYFTYQDISDFISGVKLSLFVILLYVNQYNRALKLHILVYYDD